MGSVLDTMALELSIVVPAFNEADRLPDGMKRFEAAVADGALNLSQTEVLVIDDGSVDKTADVARSLLAFVPHHRVISLPQNQGKGAAVRTGVSLARGAFTAYMDSDMAIDPRAIPLLVEGLRTNDLAIGSRAMSGSMVESTHVVRSVMGRLFNRLVTTGTGLRFQDTQCGFKALRTPVARLLFHLVRIDRFAFDVEILSQACRLGFGITEVPVQWRHVAGSTVHPLHDSVAMLHDVYRSRLGLLATPPIPGIIVNDGPVTPGSVVAGGLLESIRAVVAETLERVPVPIVSAGGHLIVLLPLVSPARCEMVLSALQDEFQNLSISHQSIGLKNLLGLGPLSGRLEAH